jgi:hypothetical protein
MKYLALTAALVVNSIILTACARLSPPAAPTGSTQQPAVTSIAPTEPPSKTPLGSSLSVPATLSTTVEQPQLTITLVGMGLPSGFPPVTPDAGHRFVAPQLTFFCKLPAGSYCQSIGSFELIDSQGTRHSPAIAVSGEGFLSKGDFPGGTSITGGMVFMVPIEAAPFLLRYVGDHGREAFFRIE